MPATQCAHLPHRLVCRAVNTAGVPQTVTCEVEVAIGGLPLAFVAQAFQGTVNSPQPTTLRSDTSNPYT